MFHEIRSEFGNVRTKEDNQTERMREKNPPTKRLKTSSCTLGKSLVKFNMHWKDKKADTSEHYRTRE